MKVIKDNRLVGSKLIKKDKKERSKRNDKDPEKNNEMNINFDSLNEITHLLKIGKNIFSILKSKKILKYSLSI